MNDRFTLICQEYVKDGCPGPVTVFSVYDKEVHAQRYVVASDAGFTWQSMQAIEPIDIQPDIDFEEITLGGWCWSELTCEPSYDQHKFTDEEFELFKYCQFEHYKIDCRRRGYHASLPIDELPKELLDRLLDDFVTQHRDNGWNVTTDGFDVYPHYSYESKVLKQRCSR